MKKGADNIGLLVEEILDLAGKGKQAGIKERDIIVAIDKKQFASVSDLIDYMSINVDQKIEIEIIRGANSTNPESILLEGSAGKLGLSLNPVDISRYVDDIQRIREIRKEESQNIAEEIQQYIDELKQQSEASKVLVSTIDYIPECKIVETLGVVFGDAYLPVENFVEDLKSNSQGFISSQGALKAVRELSVINAQIEALRMGADAIVGLHIDHEDYDSVRAVSVTATGTAVLLSVER